MTWLPQKFQPKSNSKYQRLRYHCCPWLGLRLGQTRRPRLFDSHSDHLMHSCALRPIMQDSALRSRCVLLSLVGNLDRKGVCQRGEFGLELAEMDLAPVLPGKRRARLITEQGSASNKERPWQVHEEGGYPRKYCHPCKRNMQDHTHLLPTCPPNDNSTCYTTLIVRAIAIERTSKQQQQRVSVCNRFSGGTIVTLDTGSNISGGQRHL